MLGNGCRTLAISRCKVGYCLGGPDGTQQRQVRPQLPSCWVRVGRADGSPELFVTQKCQNGAKLLVVNLVAMQTTCQL